ncbi:hypothetical protein J1N35_004558 [Gossypium stocksii]|uniref:Uncharacterized protein n=1 Tax=Gossypium stocksii TaxID=47602 RepID=A0A9D4AI53_9ROSI|nr:hypothetical protein J1N35_004558 [Gossypium stocksii]
MGGRGHIASQCPNRNIMILKENGEIESAGESEEETIPPLKETSKLEYPAEGELFVIKTNLSM